MRWIDELTLSVEDERSTEKKHFHLWAAPDVLLGTWISDGRLLNPSGHEHLIEYIDLTKSACGVNSISYGF